MEKIKLNLKQKLKQLYKNFKIIQTNSIEVPT